MGSFGDRLQREREMRSIKLEEISEATKIGTRLLRALEQEEFEKLPGGIFNKGFVRAYARYLGLDEEQAVADYEAAMAQAVAAGKLGRPETAATVTPGDLINDVPDREPLRVPWAAILALAVVAMLLYLGWKYYARNGLPKMHAIRFSRQQPTRAGVKETRGSAPAPSASPAAVLPPQSSPTTGTATRETQVAKSSDADREFVVRIKAKEASWVSIVADGRTVMSEMLAAADEKVVRARESVVVKTGNAAGVELYHNEKLTPPLGGDGQVKTVEFTSAGLRQRAAQ